MANESTGRGSLAESPWFWLSLFGGMGILAVVVIGPKYTARIARVERMQQTRERIAIERATADLRPAATSPSNPMAVDERPPNEPYVDADFGPPRRLLWLLGLMMLLMCVGVGGLLLTRHRSVRNSNPTST